MTRRSIFDRDAVTLPRNRAGLGSSSNAVTLASIGERSELSVQAARNATALTAQERNKRYAPAVYRRLREQAGERERVTGNRERTKR